jgi:ribosomal protein L37E
MAKDNPDFGGCRHCGHTPVHATARACPYCGGIAPYSKTPPRRSRNVTVALVSLAVIAAAALAAYLFIGK